MNFPHTYEPMHAFGLTMVRCPALGHRNLMLVDDFGNLVPLDNWPALAVHVAN